MIHLLRAPNGRYTLVDATHGEGQTTFAPTTAELSEKEVHAELADGGFKDQAVKDAIAQAKVAGSASLQLS
jgi:hypothetical protein